MKPLLRMSLARLSALGAALSLSVTIAACGAHPEAGAHAAPSVVRSSAEVPAAEAAPARDVGQPAEQASAAGASMSSSAARCTRESCNRRCEGTGYCGLNGVCYCW